ncbi:Starch-binding associating with outer membrane [Chitinophaga jiangningensis]|uniref:Starch-binding associating with outer membrane n=1 Tax=Chitinophaga jiangningensis TaxID=1419482 RepID=A0A1M7JAR1_9BACT|nr:RagB/SusD family nutrient uptake outer membrane protein [Chitinophaga jiangningensis]SHM50096.1 Starch-binding associating with outer membrane [Chitinophaga jiangningensis]
MTLHHLYGKIWMAGVFSIACFITACKKDFLDQKKLSAIDETAVYQDSTRSLGVINSLYANLGISFNPRRFSNTGLDAACDESEPLPDPASFTYKISSGGINPNNADKGLWGTTFQMVRIANIFLKNKDSIPVAPETRDYWTGQVRFLRAWYIFTLLKHYGGIPLIGDKIYGDNDKIDVPRSSYEDCIKYLTAELDAAAAALPTSYRSGDVNQLRVTRGSALAVKARMLLYAASPLVNSGPRGDDPEHLLTFPAADPQRWKLAADAAKAVIDLGVYSLYTASSTPLYTFFLQNTPQTEHVLVYWQPWTTANNFYIEASANPTSRGGMNGWAGVKYFPTQELVDEFDMSNGLRITDPASGYPGIGDDMYKNRDPRLTYTVHYNGSIRLLGNFGDQRVNTYTGVIPTGNAAATSASLDGIYTSTGTLTGYFRYKMCNGGGGELYRPWVVMRYAEVLLNAAEATNEYAGPTADVYDWLKLIRSRAGITPGANNMYGLKQGMTKDEMREAIRHERRVELAFEEHRFWDVRRWKIAPQTENAETHGMEITRAANGSFSYRVITIRKHVFTDAMYFWPIPQSELTKSPALKQTPGY